MSFESIIFSLSFIAPMLASLLIFLFGKKGFIKEGISFFAIILSVVSTSSYWHYITLNNNTLLLYEESFYIDGFSILMQFMVEAVALLVISYSARYIKKLYFHKKEKFHVYYSVILLSTGFMNLAFILNNLFWVYITLELSSILAVYLIVFNLNKATLKAGFKYLIFVNVGILFSLLGIILLFYATGKPVMINNIGQAVSNLPYTIALICAVLFIIGFFTKSGLIPFHLWLPDAYAEAPSAVTVFLAGAVTKMGFYGLARTVTIFAFHYEEIKILVIILAALSMLLGALLAFNQKDIKKLIAYCSISEMGFIGAALALKSYEGIFGGVFQIVNHTLIKGVLFFSVGAIIYACGTRKIEEIKESIGKIPVIGITFFIGALAVGGMPLFASFLSSITIFLALAKEFLWAAVILIIAEFISVIALLKTAIYIFWQKNEHNKAQKSFIPFTIIFCTLTCAVLIILFGIYPEIIYPLIDSATRGIIKIAG